MKRNITDRLKSKKAEAGLHWDKSGDGFGVEGVFDHRSRNFFVFKHPLQTGRPSSATSARRNTLS